LTSEEQKEKPTDWISRNAYWIYVCDECNGQCMGIQYVLIYGKDVKYVCSSCAKELID